MPRAKGAEFIVDFLAREKIPYVFGICGHGNVGLLDALYKARDKIKLVSPRHEQTAGHMADAYFRIKHQPVATLTSCGPGSANLVMALAVAQTDSSAFLAITANVPTSQFNRGPFQELNRHYQADFPERRAPGRQAQRSSRRAWSMLPLDDAAGGHDHDQRAARSGQPGRALQPVPGGRRRRPPRRRGTASTSGAAAPRRRTSRPPSKMLLAAQRPVLFIGHGVTLSEAAVELTALAHRLRHSRHQLAERHGLLRHDGPAVARLHRPQRRLSGQPGRPLHRPGAGDRRALRRSLVLVVDARLLVELPGRQAGPRRRRSRRDRPQLRAEPRHPRRRAHVPPPAAGRDRHAATCRGAAVPKPGRSRSPAGARNGRTTCARTSRSILAAASGARGGRLPNGAAGRRHHLARLRRAPQLVHAVLGGAPAADHAQHLGLLGMGFGPSGILGAKLAAPDRPCISICGDGGFTMVPHVLCTAVEYDIPVGVGGVEQLRLGRDPRPAVRHVLAAASTARRSTRAPTTSRTTPTSPPGRAPAASRASPSPNRRTSRARWRMPSSSASRCCSTCMSTPTCARRRTGTWSLPPIPHKEPMFGKPFVREPAAE